MKDRLNLRNFCLVFGCLKYHTISGYRSLKDFLFVPGKFLFPKRSDLCNYECLHDNSTNPSVIKYKTVEVCKVLILVVS